jgi:hypothetical protein
MALQLKSACDDLAKIETKVRTLATASKMLELRSAELVEYRQLYRNCSVAIS